jgi:hypothetical protein
MKTNTKPHELFLKLVDKVIFINSLTKKLDNESYKEYLEWVAHLVIKELASTAEAFGHTVDRIVINDIIIDATFKQLEPYKVSH